MGRKIMDTFDCGRLGQHRIPAAYHIGQSTTDVAECLVLAPTAGGRQLNCKSGSRGVSSVNTHFRRSRNISLELLADSSGGGG